MKIPKRGIFNRFNRRMLSLILRDERRDTHTIIKQITDRDLKRYSLVKDQKTKRQKIGYIELVLGISGRHMQAIGFNYKEAAKKIEEVREREEALKNWGKDIENDEYHQKLLSELYDIFGSKKYLKIFQDEIPMADRALKIRFKQVQRSMT